MAKRKHKSMLQNRVMTRTEALLGVFMALLLPALTAGLALPELTAAMLKF